MPEIEVILASWIAAFLTLAIYSFVYKENPWFRFAEHLFIGGTMAYTLALNIDWLVKNAFIPVFVEGKFPEYILAFIIGLLWYCRFSRRFFWLYRIPLAIMVGTGIGLAMRTVVMAQFIKQIQATILPLVGVPIWDPKKVSGPSLINNILIILMVIGVVSYFYFSVERKGPFKIGAEIGKWTIMLGLGAFFGNTVMARMALAIGRIGFLVAPEQRIAFLVLAIVILGTMGYLSWIEKKKAAATATTPTEAT